MPPQDSEIAVWFAKEVLPHEHTLRKYLFKIARASDIDDLVQESYSRLLRMQERGTVHSTRGLLFTVARNAAHDLFRRRGVAGQTETLVEHEPLQLLDETPGVPELVSRAQEYGLLAEAIKELPDRCRDVFILRQIENLSQREIARRLEISEHTVAAHLAKGLRRCTSYLRAHGAVSNGKAAR